MDFNYWINGGKDRIKTLFDLKHRRERVLAFKKCFMDENGQLTDDGKIVISYLRDVCRGRCEIRDAKGAALNRTPGGMFDRDGYIFLGGQQRLFALIIQHLSLDELELFNLRNQIEDDDENLIRKLVI